MEISISMNAITIPLDIPGVIVEDIIIKEDRIIIIVSSNVRLSGNSC